MLQVGDKVSLTVDKVVELGGDEYSVSFQELPSIFVPCQGLQPEKAGEAVSEAVPVERIEDSKKVAESLVYLLKMNPNTLVETFNLESSAFSSYDNFKESLIKILEYPTLVFLSKVQDLKDKKAQLGDIVEDKNSGERGIVVGTEEDIYYLWSNIVHHEDGVVSTKVVMRKEDAINLNQRIDISKLTTMLDAPLRKKIDPIDLVDTGTFEDVESVDADETF